MKPRAEITKKCALCEIGRLSPDGKTVLCVNRGVMQPDDCCRKFRYDPLKREPIMPKMTSHDKSEFEL